MGETSDKPPDTPTDRRGFFREGLASLLGPLAGLVERKLNQVEQALGPGSSARRRGPAPRLLRPPGALPEAQFLATCQSCGKCASVCPAEAIYLIRGSPEVEHIHPVISAAQQPCVVCESLACMQNCPSGALVPTPAEQIDMGLAVLRPQHCLRTHGEGCTECVTHCPLGEKAIHLASEQDTPAGRLPAIFVEENGCIGCGLCEFRCPTDPRAIIVQPHR